MKIIHRPIVIKGLLREKQSRWFCLDVVTIGCPLELQLFYVIAWLHQSAMVYGLIQAISRPDCVRVWGDRTHVVSQYISPLLLNTEHRVWKTSLYETAGRAELHYPSAESAVKNTCLQRQVFLWERKLLKCEYFSSGIEQASISLLAHHQLINSTRLIFPGSIEDLASNFYRIVYLSKAIISNSVLKFNRFADSFC